MWKRFEPFPGETNDEDGDADDHEARAGVAVFTPADLADGVAPAESEDDEDDAAATNCVADSVEAVVRVAKLMDEEDLGRAIAVATTSMPIASRLMTGLPW